MEILVLKHRSIMLAFEVERFPGEMHRVSQLKWEAAGAIRKQRADYSYSKARGWKKMGKYFGQKRKIHTR